MAGETRRKLMVIGLDTGDGRLIRRWCREGHMPVLRSLIDAGAWGWLETTADTLHVSAWPSLYTGASAGGHGVYYTFQPAPGIQGYRRFAADQYGRPTFWKLLSEAGHRCTVFDAPYTHPEADFNGTQIFEWGTWAQYWHRMSTPRALMGRLNRACGSYPLGKEAHDVGLMHLDAEEMRRRLLPSARAKTDAAIWLVRESTWDLFVVVFGETHPGAHYCWTPPLAGVPEVDGNQELLRSVYAAIDEGIGRLLAELDDSTTVLIISGDGVGPNYSGWHLLPETLRRLGFFAEAGPIAGAGEGEVDARPRGGRSHDPVKLIRDLVPKDMRKAFARRLPTGLRDALARRVDTAGIDWSNTRAYCLPTDLEGYIRINLEGREPSGIVREGAEYERVCAELSAQLGELTDPGSGCRLVRKVVRCDAEFAGPRRPYLPDLIVVWNSEAPITRVSSPRIGIVDIPSPDARTGTHSPPGFVLARGPRVAAGGTIDGGHIRDLAPTILREFGVPMPDYMTGSVWDYLTTH